MRTVLIGVAASPAPDPILIHPSMAVTYRERVAALIAGLGRSAEMPAAKEALRALVDRIVLIPAAGRTGVEIELEGDLAALLRLATARNGHTIELIGELAGILRLGGLDATKPPRFARAVPEMLVAGARIGHCFISTEKESARPHLLQVQ